MDTILELLGGVKFPELSEGHVFFLRGRDKGRVFTKNICDMRIISYEYSRRNLDNSTSSSTIF